VTSFSLLAPSAGALASAGLSTELSVGVLPDLSVSAGLSTELSVGALPELSVSFPELSSSLLAGASVLALGSTGAESGFLTGSATLVGALTLGIRTAGKIIGSPLQAASLLVPAGGASPVLGATVLASGAAQVGHLPKLSSSASSNSLY
jgi:hypothetical protein